MENQLHFVYAPKSGPKFIERCGPRPAAVPALVYQNESAHVLGARFEFHTSKPGHWYRHHAQEFLKGFCGETGSIAWDRNGHISVVVSPHHFKAASSLLEHFQVMRAAAGLGWAPEEDLNEFRLRGSLFRIGAGWLIDRMPLKLPLFLAQKADEWGEAPPLDGERNQVRHLIYGPFDDDIERFEPAGHIPTEVITPWNWSLGVETFGMEVIRDFRDDSR
jgi:hypothetical protein